jgi:hypothetical protein
MAARQRQFLKYGPERIVALRRSGDLGPVLLVFGLPFLG